MELHGIAVLSQETQSKPLRGKGYVACGLGVTGHPETIILQVRVGGNGITPIGVHEMRPYEASDDGKFSFKLVVPVAWTQRDGIWIPHTRTGERDFMNVILIDGNLGFRDVQISLLSRKGYFYVVIQEVFSGWIRLENDEICFVPGDSVFAYPGMDYRTTWKGRSEILAVMARIVHSVLEATGTSLETPMPAVWAPRPVTPLTGWETGHASFFCPITNTGHIIAEKDGEILHVWGNNLVGVPGPIQMLNPMAGVYFRPGEQKEGQAFRSVKSCKPA